MLMSDLIQLIVNNGIGVVCVAYMIYFQLTTMKEMNKTMPKYKAIRGVLITEKELIKTTTNKIKRQANLDAIEKSSEGVYI